MAKNTSGQVYLTTDELVEKTSQHYWSKGFPYYGVSADQKHGELIKLRSFDHTKLIVDKKVGQSMHGLKLA